MNISNISVIGIGRLGLCMALCFENNGFSVLGVDTNEEYINQINSKTLKSFEPKVEKYLLKSEKFEASMSLEEGLQFSNLIFIVVPTPNGKGDNHYDHSILIKVLSDINKLKVKGKHLVISCTVMPGFISGIGKKLLSDCEGCTLNYNPEFIAQGSIITNFLNPDIILIGEENKEAGDLISKVYHSIHDCKFPHRMTTLEAEIAKIALNGFVTTKIAYANLIGDLCLSMGVKNPDVILEAIGDDSRVGSKYFKYGYSFGGPCFLVGQIVFTQYGIKEIQNIKTGDAVLTEDGKLAIVFNPMVSQYKGKIYKICTRGSTPVFATENHGFYVSKDMRKTYIVNGKPRQMSSEKSVLESLGEMEKVEAKDLTKEYFALFPIPEERSVNIPKHASKEYIELAGYYLSEGSLDFKKRKDGPRPQRIKFSFHAKEVEYHKRVDELGRKLGYNPTHHKRTESQGYDVRIASVVLAKQLMDDFSHLSWNKIIPYWILYGSLENIKLLMRGIWRGDGHTCDKGFTLGTTSPNIAYGVKLMLMRLGIPCSIRRQEERTGADGVHHRVSYFLNIRNSLYTQQFADTVGMENKNLTNGNVKGTFFIKDNYCYHRILNIETFDYEGPVYNLSVLGTHKYVVDCGLVSNCFPRDLLAVAQTIKDMKLNPVLPLGAHQANQEHIKFQADQLLNDDRNEYVFTDICYKPESKIPIIEHSAKLKIAEILAKNGKKVIIKDQPQLIDLAKKEYGNIFEYIYTN